MLINEETKLNVVESISKEENELNEVIDNTISALPLETTEKQLLEKIIDAPDKASLERELELFNINQTKKNALRIIKLENLLDKVEDQAIERFQKRPDQVSNKELLDYMNVVSNQIDRAQRSVDNITATPAITVNNKTNTVNVNMGGPELDRDSKERVMDAISNLLKQVKKPKVEEPEVIDATTKENSEVVDEEENLPLGISTDLLNTESEE